MASTSPEGRPKLWQRHSEDAPEDSGGVSGVLSPRRRGESGSMASTSPEGATKLWQRHSEEPPEDFGGRSGPLSPRPHFLKDEIIASTVLSTRSL